MNDAKDEEIVSNSSSQTTVESPESVKELIMIEHSNSYATFMKRLNLKRPNFKRNVQIDYNDPAKPKLMAEIIYHNFVEGHLYGCDRVFHNLSINERYNSKILYHLVQDEEVLNLIGFKYCLNIIKEIIKFFKSYSVHRKGENFKQIFQSVAIDLVDFLEFILNELAPKYPFSLNDPLYNFEAHCKLEYFSLIYVNSIFNFSVLKLFNEPDLLKNIVRRYSAVWPASMTHNIISEASLLSPVNENPYLFREILTFMVKRVPDYFVHVEQSIRYTTNIKSFKNHIRGTMNIMAPIFRALMLIDNDVVINEYLEIYYNQLIKPDYYPCFSSQDDSIKALNFFIRDSKFVLINSHAMRERKRILLEKILSKFFGINQGNICKLIRFTLLNDFLPLYEVLLQHFNVKLFERQKLELIEILVKSTNIEASIPATVISMGYLEIEDFDSLLNELDPENDQVFDNLPWKRYEDLFKIQKVRFNLVKEIYKLIQSCPIQRKVSIFVDEEFMAVPWEFTSINFYEEEEENDENNEYLGNYPKLFYYAQAILCKYFGITFFGVSFFESAMNESVTWSEMIGFINFMIESQSKLLYSQRETNLFKFIDSTKY